MPKLFKQLKFGLAPVTITPAKLVLRNQILISYINTCYINAAQYDVETCAEIFNIAKEYIGIDFKMWVIANYMNGKGSRAPLCKAIAKWVNKEIPGRIVIETLKRDLARLDFLKDTQEQIKIPIVDNLSTERFQDNVDFSKIKDKHFFDFLALLGPELVAHFCLSLDGIRYKQ